MKTLTDDELEALAGQYFAPAGLYQHTKRLPFLGSLECGTQSLTAGQWTELAITYTVGASGLADGAWIKGTFKFYSDWALFQTADPRQDNYVSAEYRAADLRPGQTPATVQSLAVRFDQKGHERPFQKAVIVDVVDGYMNPGDRIVVRLGDRRWGSRGTRVQTFVEDDFRMRWYIDPVGTSRFAPIKPDLALAIRPGPIARLRAITPRVARPGAAFPVHVHAEDAWGNATADIRGLEARVSLRKGGSGVSVWEERLPLPEKGWTAASLQAKLPEDDGDYELTAMVTTTATAAVAASAVSQASSSTHSTSTPVTVESSLPVPRPLFADLHVHSDDTVGTNSTTYNFSYARAVAGLDVVGYTANDFNITKARWDRTLDTIRDVNAAGEFVVFPGTEWCGNSAAGGDHNVVFLGDDGDDGPPEFPLDRRGNVARSFEWNEDGPAELQPGAWPLDEVYATYAHAPDKHLLIPHVGGRRCNLAWHHPRLERLLEIGSAWGLFEWLLRDAVKRGWRMGVSANSDEHRGRCGGGVPGTAVFGTKGGLTGVLAERLERGHVGQGLRARRTFATTGERLVGVVSTRKGDLQGDDVYAQPGDSVALDYKFYGDQGFASVEAWDASGKIFDRNLQTETSEAVGSAGERKLRVKWGGARLYDRYREAVWDGSVIVSGSSISSIQPFGGVRDNPEEVIKQVSATQIVFATRTSGDFDGVDIYLAPESQDEWQVSVTGQLGGYVKVGNPLQGNAHKPQPVFSLSASPGEASQAGGKHIDIRGGADLFVSIEHMAAVELPKRVQGTFVAPAPAESDSPDGVQAVYFVGREHNGGKVITSPVFIHRKP